MGLVSHPNYQFQAPTARLSVCLCADCVLSTHQLESSEELQQEEEDGDEEESQSPVCVLCEFVMMQLKLKLDDNSTDVSVRGLRKDSVVAVAQVQVQSDCIYTCNRQRNKECRISAKVKCLN